MADYSSRGLQSEFRWNQKLRNCADHDNDHISKDFSPVGGWVNLIHKALNAWSRRVPSVYKPVPPQLPETNHFTEQTAEMVRQFKEFYGLVNYAGKIDRVVGKKTVYWLDKELPKQPFDP